MPYIVLDLEWNQAMSSKSSVFNHLPIRLSGEIIQIGAVKLTDDFLPGGEFQADVRPVYFRRMHYKVKKLTGFDKDRLIHGVKFKEAMKSFWEWCGPDCIFLTWGYDDKNIMEQNLIIHDLDIDWMGKWINLQLIYNMQTGGDKNQKSLASAMEHFGIEQTRVAHDALGDAYNTALICSKLDLTDGLHLYDEASKILTSRVRQERDSENSGPIPIEHVASDSYDSRGALWADKSISGLDCPECGVALETARWVNQGDSRYMSVAECPEHGVYLIRLKLRHSQDDCWSANRLVYKADKDMQELYRSKALQSRKRKKRRNYASIQNKKTTLQTDLHTG